MITLPTVTGPLPIHSVTGPVLPHEHLVLDLDRTGDRAAVLHPEHHAPAVTGELAALREDFGLSLLIEPTCRGMGRDAPALARISRASGVAVIAATGWYYEPFHPPEIRGDPVELLTETLVREIVDGIGYETGYGYGTGTGTGTAYSTGTGTGTGTGTSTSTSTAYDTSHGPGVGIHPSGARPARIRPGLIGEVGSHGEEPSEPEARVLRAAARAARATGLSVATHAHLGHGGPAQLALLTHEGLAPERVSIGHQDLLDQPSVHRALAASGAYIAFDTIGKERYRSDGERLRSLLALLDAGHADRALLSCDISRHAYLRSEGGQGYGHLFHAFLPALRAAGADDALLDLLTRRNPLRFLTGTDPGPRTPTPGPTPQEP
ncbi:phosphotriesterase family protein [Streptomyces jumonjinensis]|uniref:Phosphotriesterase n=1 Tax=Streptomyces jumonjinensis TaxID=1945 RepID=A0A646KL56_STRJU|nr:phosphotriesterase [Streptomyces jumonjinensis]MQT02945.1 phosphotriesterase [Streptomyces jumonjinensis]